MPVLVVHEPSGVAYFVPLHDGLVVGRHQASDLVLADLSVSRRHARLCRTGDDGYAVSDLGSKLGTFVNDEVVVEHQQRSLRAGDRIRLGRMSLVYQGGLDGERDRILAQQLPTMELALAQVSDDDARRLRLLCQLGAALGAGGDILALLRSTLDAILEALSAVRGLVSGVNCGANGPSSVERLRGAPGRVQAPIGRQVLQAVSLRREAVIVGEPGASGARPAMAAPLESGMRSGAFIYLEREAGAPAFSAADLAFFTVFAHLVTALVENSIRHESASRALEALGARLGERRLLGRSRAFEALIETVRRHASAGSVPILVRGESGSGKELVAEMLHQLSSRAAGPFVAVNCAAIPDTMVEAELFGHAKGAFTGALRDHRGKFQLADRGTLFLDEIGDLPAPAQAKILRAVELGEIQPLGAERTQRVDVRVIAATHRDLREEIRAGRFREDLYYRLCVGELHVPPLRKRREDIPLLAEAFVATAAQRMGKRCSRLSPAAVSVLMARPWPGNVRELRNAIERAALLATGDVIEAADLTEHGSLPATVRDAARSIPGEDSGADGVAGSLAAEFAALALTERKLVERAFRQARGNLAEAARLLGISRVMMKRRAVRLGLGLDSAALDG